MLSSASGVDALQVWQLQSAACRRSVFDEKGFPSDLTDMMQSLCCFHHVGSEKSTNEGTRQKRKIMIF